MTKNELIHIASKHCLTRCDIEDAVRFVHELLVHKAEVLEQTEPYAVKTIKSLYDAAHEVDELEFDVDEIMEGSYE